MMGSWIPTRLSEVVRQVKRLEPVDPAKQYRLVGVRLDGGGPFLRETKLGSESSASSLSQIRKGDFIFSRLFAWRGAFGVVPPDLDGCYVSNEFPTFEVDDRRIDAEFLRLWFRLPATIRAVEEKCSGSTPLTRNRFKEPSFLAMEIPLPPLDEQRRIVARIEGLAAKIEEAGGLRADAAVEARAVLLAARKSIYDHGAITTLGALTQLSCGGAWGNDDDSNGVAVLRANNISGSGDLVLSGLRYRSVPERQVGKLRLKDGDIIMTKSNSLEIVGNSALFHQPQGDHRTYIPSNFLQLIRLDPTACNPRFVWHCLMSTASKDYYRQNASGTSPSLQNLNGSKISSIPIPAISLQEQGLMVAHLDRIQEGATRLQEMQAQTASELDALLPSVLDKAFRGEL